MSPHPHQQPPPFNFSSQPPQQQQQQPPSVASSMRASSPSSPGSVKSVNLSNNTSILERTLREQGIKQEFKQEVQTVATASSRTPASMTNCIATPMAEGHNHLSQQQIEEFQHQQQQFQQQPQQQQQQQPQHLQHHQYPDGILGPEVFPMKPEVDIDSVDLHYYGNVPVGHHHIGGVAGPQGHHLVGPTRVSGGQEDHLHSPSQYSMATQQQPPWVR